MRGQRTKWFLLLSGILAASASAQIAKGWSKFLGNTTGSNKIRSDFSTYWNQISPENCGSWYTIEGRRGNPNWSCLDSVAAFARRQGIPWTFHSLVTSGSYPAWFASLPPDTMKVAFEAWIATAASRYPDVPLVEVVCEGHPQHYPPSFLMTALGGKGTTGRDWIIEAFRIARRHFPKATLILSDFNILEDATVHAWYLETVQALRKADVGLDAIGYEAFQAYQTPLPTLRSNLDRLIDSTKLPVYITQFEVPLPNDSAQKAVYSQLIPFFYEHPAVKGMTVSGYVVGNTFRDGSGLVTAAGVERPAMTWLRSYSPSTTSTRLAMQPRPRSEGVLEIRKIDGRLVVGVIHQDKFRPLFVGL